MQSLATDELNEQPSELEHAVNLISKSAQTRDIGVSMSVTLRLPAFVYSTLKAMSEHSGQSLNKVTVSLLRVAIDSVSASLAAEDVEGIDKFRNAIIQDLIHGNTFDKGVK